VTRVFVDTSAWYAVIDRADADHAFATAILARLTGDATRLVTTTLILAELHRLMLYRSHRRAAADAINRIVGTPRVDVEHTDAGDLAAAIAWIERFADQDFTLTDASSFAVMDRLAIRRAFAFDHDFAVAGFELVV
jgi:predicted nucleic acid-binding protein